MQLARLAKERPCELRADLQQYYGLNLDGMGADYSHAHAACCAAQLPPGARVWRDDAAEWTPDTYLLSHIEHLLHVLAWQQSKDGQNERNYPEHRETPATRHELERKIAASVAGRRRIDEILGPYAPKGGD